MNLKILHISDSHIFSLSGNLNDMIYRERSMLRPYYNISKRMRIFFTRKEKNHNLFLLKNALKGQDYSHLVFTGDLTQTSNYNEFLLGKSALLELQASLNSSFSIIPGNHDNLPNRDKLNFYSFFNIPRGNYIQVFRESGYCVIGFDSTSFVQGMKRPLSALEYATISSKGEVSKKQLLWLRDVLKNPEYSGLYKIILLHHHPITHRNDTFIRNMALPRIRNSRTFVSYLGDMGVNLVLYGHKHPKTSCYKRVGNIHFVLGPSIRDGLYNCIELHGNDIDIKTLSI